MMPSMIRRYRRPTLPVGVPGQLQHTDLLLLPAEAWECPLLLQHTQPRPQTRTSCTHQLNMTDRLS